MGSKEYNREYMRLYREKYPDRVKATRLKMDKKGRYAYNTKWRDENPARTALYNCRKSAKERGLSCEIELSDLVIPQVCPVFNTPFVKHTMYSVSVDRINNKVGYTADNIQIISRKANIMKNSASVEELVAFARWVQKTYPKEWLQDE